MNHHELIRSAFDEGAESLLLMEDDVRFLKDAERAKKILVAWRETGCDLVMFDRFLWANNFPSAFDAGGERFVRFVDQPIRGTACYALTRNGMEEFLRTFETWFVEKHKMLVADEIPNLAKIGKCFSETCVCVQKEFDGNNNAAVYNVSQYDVYRRNGVDLDAYNL